MTPNMIRTGVDLYVEEGGKPGPTLVLLHGLGANGDVWKPMLPLLLLMQLFLPLLLLPLLFPLPLFVVVMHGM